MEKRTDDAPVGSPDSAAASAPSGARVASRLALAIHGAIVGGWVVLSVIYITAAPASVRPAPAQMLSALLVQALTVEMALVAATLGVMRMARTAGRIVDLLGGCAMLAVAGVVLLVAVIITFPQY